MVHRRIKRSLESRRLANHNRSWIWGRHVVTETVRAGRWPILQLAVSQTLDFRLRDELLDWAAGSGTPLLQLEERRLTQRCRAADHQGCAALMGEFPYLAGDRLIQHLPADARLIVLDRIQDPFNFGAIVRTVDGLGLSGIVIGAKEQTGVNSQAARSSAGAVNHVLIAKVEDLSSFLRELARNSWQIWGATERGAVALDQARFKPPLALIIGNEGTGISPELQTLCTGSVRIPMEGHVGSLNAAVSAGILCYELVRPVSYPQSAS